jgi:hypothetical protein
VKALEPLVRFAEILILRYDRQPIRRTTQVEGCPCCGAAEAIVRTNYSTCYPKIAIPTFGVSVEGRVHGQCSVGSG